MKNLLLAWIILTIFGSTSIFAQDLTLSSPDGNILLTVALKDKIYYSLAYKGKEILSQSPISMITTDGMEFGIEPRFRRKLTSTVNRIVTPPFGEAQNYPEQYNEMNLLFRGNYNVVFRAYDDGMAYRIVTSSRKSLKVKQEEVAYNFADNFDTHALISENWHNYEDNYKNQKLSDLQEVEKISLPMLVSAENGPFMIISEADLLDYPGLYLTKSANNNGLQGVFPALPTQTEVGGHRNFNLLVQETADYIAETGGDRNFPWRVISFSDSETELLENHLIYLLASESTIEDESWIQPGKVAWDWWNDINLTGVDFKSGYNTESFKYFIDFAAANDIKYVNLDDGWSDQFDLLKPNDQLDIQEVVRYAREKNVGLFLWCVWHTLDRQMQEALDQFQEWGIAGIKVDFMDRDDQLAVNFYERTCREAAKRNILVNFHGAYKPTGLRRTYPNLINRESVLGLEYYKFSDKANPEHEVTIPFIRMHVGPMDFTPGGMSNSTADNFHINFTSPLTRGTRGHQLGMFVVYFAPLQMLADAPTAYEAEPEILEFLSKVPTVWDETVPVTGKIGDYVVIARRKGEDWFIGGLSDWEARNVEFVLDFLEDGNYAARIFKDGLNADKNPEDFKVEDKKVTAGGKMNIDMAPGGGFVIQLTKTES